MRGPRRSAGAGRDALPVRHCTSRRFFLLLLRTRSCAIGGSFPVLFFHLHFLWTYGAGSRGSASRLRSKQAWNMEDMFPRPIRDLGALTAGPPLFGIRGWHLNKPQRALLVRIQFLSK